MIAWICHKLFGWEYWAVNYGFETYVRRCRTYKNGDKYVVVGGTHIAVTNPAFHREVRQVY